MTVAKCLAQLLTCHPSTVMPKAGVTRCNFPCQLSRNVGKNKSIATYRGHVTHSNLELQRAKLLRVYAFVEDCRIEFCLAQWLQVQRSCKINFTEDMLHPATSLQLVSQCNCCTRLQGKSHRVTRAKA